MNQNRAKISNEFHNICLNINNLVNIFSNNNLNNNNNPVLNYYSLNPNNLFRANNNMSVPFNN